MEIRKLRPFRFLSSKISAGSAPFGLGASPPLRLASLASSLRQSSPPAPSHHHQSHSQLARARVQTKQTPQNPSLRRRRHRPASFPPSLPPSLPHSDPYPRSTLNPTPSPAAAAAGAGKKKCRARSSRSRWGNAGTRSGWSSGSSYASSMASARTASSRTSPLRYVPHAPHSPFSPVPVSVTCPSPPLLTRWPRLSRLMAVSGLLEISAAGALICDVCGYGGEAR